MSEKLEKCPWCPDGGKPEVLMEKWENPNPGYSGGQGKLVQCKNCGSTGRWINVHYFNWFSKYSVDELRNNNALRATEENRYEKYVLEREIEAISAWNIRHPPRRSREEIEEVIIDTIGCDSRFDYKGTAAAIERLVYGEGTK